MINRKLLVEALRIDNKDVLPKFGSSELRKVMEAGTEYLNIDNLMDYEEGTLTDDGVYTIMDLLDHGSVGIADSDGQPALTFMKSGSDIHMHNQFTDEDLVLDATAEALKEAVADQMHTDVFEEGEKAEQPPMELTNVVFKKEDDGEVLAVFPDDTDTVGDEMNILVYSHQGQHGYANPIYVEALEDATPEEYESLAEELRGQGYNLNILNGMSADDQAPSTDMVDPYEGTYHEESINEEMKNYGILVAKDMGNESKILEIREGFGSYEEAQEGIDQIEHEYDFEDPTLFTCIVYSDGVSWFIADTGEELDLEQYESASKPESYSPDIEALVEDIEHSFATAGLSLGRRLLSKFGMDDSAFDKLANLQGHVEERLDQVVEDIINNL